MQKKKAVRDLTGAPMRRIWHIHARVSRGEKTNATQLAKELGTSERSIWRDIEDMKWQLGIPIEWSDELQKYYYTGPCEAMPAIGVDRSNALLFVSAACFMAACGGPSFGRKLKELLEKLAPLLGGVVSFSFDSVAERVSTKTARANNECRWFLALLDAALQHAQVELRYAKPRTEPEKRVVQPLHLAESDGSWVVLAFDEGRREMRTFRLSRVHGVRRTGITFPPRAFDVDKLLHGSVGRFTADKEIEVRIAVSPVAEYYVRERPWHRSQVITPQPGEWSELMLRVTSTVEVKNKVLAWGSHMVVLSPPELREEVHGELRATLARYETAAETSRPSPDTAFSTAETDGTDGRQDSKQPRRDANRRE